MTTDTTTPDTRTPAGADTDHDTTIDLDLDLDPDLALEAHGGWQALAIASLGRLLTDTELAAAEHLPVEVALDLFFPHLGDAARHEALSTLG